VEDPATHSTTASETKGAPGFEPRTCSSAVSRSSRSATCPCDCAARARPSRGTRPSMRRCCARESRRARAPGVKSESQAWEACVMPLRCARSRRHRTRGQQRLGAASRHRQPRPGQFGGPFACPQGDKTMGRLSIPAARWMNRWSSEPEIAGLESCQGLVHSENTAPRSGCDARVHEKC
jgi:hypothetical protein